MHKGHNITVTHFSISHSAHTLTSYKCTRTPIESFNTLWTDMTHKNTTELRHGKGCVRPAVRKTAVSDMTHSD